MSDYQDIFAGLGSLASDELASNMQAWEKAQPLASASPPTPLRKLRPVWIKWAAAAAVILCLGIGLNWQVNSNYSNTALLADNYIAPGSRDLMGNNTPTITRIQQLRTMAHAKFVGKEYALAIPLFDQVITEVESSELDALTKKSYKENAEWNKALAMIADNRSQNSVIGQLEKIASTSGHEYQEKANQLIQKMKSIWRRLAN